MGIGLIFPFFLLGFNLGFTEAAQMVFPSNETLAMKAMNLHIYLTALGATIVMAAVVLYGFLKAAVLYTNKKKLAKIEWRVLGATDCRYVEYLCDIMQNTDRHSRGAFKSGFTSSGATTRTGATTTGGTTAGMSSTGFTKRTKGGTTAYTSKGATAYTTKGTTGYSTKGGSTTRTGKTRSSKSVF
ncbi:unnamed protein product [Auanema sp. JU1783]|nr:unnamed protein product [Auanema sp. JU1783]